MSVSAFDTRDNAMDTFQLAPQRTEVLNPAQVLTNQPSFKEIAKRQTDVVAHVVL